MKRVFAWLTVCLLALVLAGCGTASPAETVPTEADKTDDNYRVFYEIFVGSFADSDGDGTGDLNGILRHLDYLTDGNLLSDTSLGVLGLWTHYVKSLHGDNKLMKELLCDYPDRYTHFQFSILQLLPKAVTPDEVIQTETLWKKKLLTYEPLGMNAN